MARLAPTAPGARRAPVLLAGRWPTWSAASPLTCVSTSGRGSMPRGGVSRAAGLSACPRLYRRASAPSGPAARCGVGVVPGGGEVGGAV